MGFNVVHAYVIEALDTHPCQVSEYVHDVSGSSEIADDDICHLHHFFHIAFILPTVSFKFSQDNFTQNPFSKSSLYEYDSSKNFLKPPIQS